MDPSINRPAGTGVTAVTEEKGEEPPPDERPHYVGVCERGVGSRRGPSGGQRPRRPHWTERVCLSPRTPSHHPHNSFLLRGPIGGSVAEVSSKTLRLGVNWVVVEERTRGGRPLPGPGF